MKKIIIALLLLSPFMPAMATNDVSNIETSLSNIELLLDKGVELYLGGIEGYLYNEFDDQLDRIDENINKCVTDNFTTLYDVLDTGVNLYLGGIEGYLYNEFDDQLDRIDENINIGVNGNLYNIDTSTKGIYDLLISPEYGQQSTFNTLKDQLDILTTQTEKEDSHNKALKDQLSAIEQAIYQVKGALSWAEGDEDDGLAYLLRGIKDDVEKQNPFFEDYQESQGNTDSFSLPEYYTFSVLNDLNKDIKEINLQSSINPEYQCQNLFDMIKQYFKRSIEMQSSDHKGLAVIARAILQTDPKQNEVEQDVKMALADAHSQMHEIQAEYSFKDLEDKIKFDQHEKYFDFDDLLDQFKFSTPNNWFSLGQVSLSDNAHLYLDFDISGLMPYLDFSRRLFTGLYFVCLAGLVWFIWNKILPFLYKFASYIKALFS